MIKHCLFLNLLKSLKENGNNTVESPCDEDTPKFTAKKWKSWSEEEKQNILLKYRLAFYQTRG